MRVGRFNLSGSAEQQRYGLHSPVTAQRHVFSHHTGSRM
jgi:hypothetical protein